MNDRVVDTEKLAQLNRLASTREGWANITRITMDKAMENGAHCLRATEHLADRIRCQVQIHSKQDDVVYGFIDLDHDAWENLANADEFLEGLNHIEA